MTAKRILKATGLLAFLAAAGGAAAPAAAQDYYLGEIILVGYTFCPSRTAEADGRLLAVSENQALFSLYGCTYGGDCRTSFALPDLRGRAPIGVGQGPGLPSYPLGQKGGSPSVTTTVGQMPSHSHAATTTATLQGSTASATTSTPSSSAVLGTPAVGIYSSGSAATALAPSSVAAETTVAATGGGQPISVQDPYVTLRYCVVTSGTYPSRN